VLGEVLGGYSCDKIELRVITLTNDIIAQRDFLSEAAERVNFYVCAVTRQNLNDFT